MPAGRLQTIKIRFFELPHLLGAGCPIITSVFDAHHRDFRALPRANRASASGRNRSPDATSSTDAVWLDTSELDEQSGKRIKHIPKDAGIVNVDVEGVFQPGGSFGHLNGYTNRTGQHGSWSGEVLRGTTAWM